MFSFVFRISDSPKFSMGSEDRRPRSTVRHVVPGSELKRSEGKGETPPIL